MVVTRQFYLLKISGNQNEVSEPSWASVQTAWDPLIQWVYVYLWHRPGSQEMS